MVAVAVALVWPTGVQADPYSADLASLSVTDQNGAAIDLGAFDPATTAYSASVGSAVERVHIKASAKARSWAYIDILPRGDTRGSETIPGHQVELNHGANLILVIVTSSVRADSPVGPGESKTYSVTITRAGSAPEVAPTMVRITPAMVRISSVYAVTEGDTIPHLLTRTGNTAQALTVAVSVSERGDMLPSSSKGTFNVKFQAGSASAKLDLPTNSDSVVQGNSLVKASLLHSEAYDIDESASIALTLVEEDDYPLAKVTLESIALSDQSGTTIDIGSFDADTRTYTGNVGSETQYITVAPKGGWINTHTDETPHANIRILPSDSRPYVAGHQVDLSHGKNLISIMLPYDHGDYEVIINRAGSATAGAPKIVGIHGFAKGIDVTGEGATLPFILTRTGDTSDALTVTVNVSETGGDMVPAASEGQSNFEFAAGFASAKFEVATVGDYDWEEHSFVVADLVDGDGYQVSDNESRGHAWYVKDNDLPALTAAFTVDSSQVEEGEDVTVTVTVTTDEAQQPHQAGYNICSLTFTTQPGTARDEDFEFSGDIEGISTGVIPNPNGIVSQNLHSPSRPEDSIRICIPVKTFEPVLSDEVVTAYRSQFSFPISITDDDRPEPDETFDILLEWQLPLPAGSRTLAMDQGIGSRTITIPENWEIPEPPDPASHVTVAIADSGSTGSTYTVTWNDAGECPIDQEYHAYLTSTHLSTFGHQDGWDDDFFAWTTNRKLGSTGPEATSERLVKTLDTFPLSGLSGQRDLRLYCGDMTRLISKVPLPWRTENSIERPVPGIYSSEPALTSLTVSPGTLGPKFANYGFLYAVLVPQDTNRITLNATAKAGYAISWDPARDADPATDGHQVNLSEGYNSIFASVDHDQGVNSFLYEVIVKRAGSSDLTGQTAATPSMPCLTQAGTLAETARFEGNWDNADCKAHHQDSRARYFHFTLAEETEVSISLSAGALYVSNDTPQNDWGTPPAGSYEHRKSVRADKDKLLHDGSASTFSQTLAAGEYTAEVAQTASGGNAFTLEIDLPQPPAFDVNLDTALSVAENSAAGTNVGSPITATDPNVGDTLTYSLSGNDATSFDIGGSTGQIATKSGITYNFESKSSYSLTVEATDDGGLSDTIAVTVSLTDVNEAPVFAASSATREVAENSAAGTNVGSPITATDPDTGDTLAYSLSGTDASSFAIDATGQITTVADVAYDYETDSSYLLAVEASDGKLSASITVTINLTNVEETDSGPSSDGEADEPANRDPAFADGASTTRSVAENSPAGTNVGAVVTATDPDDDTLTYSLSGTDASSFEIGSSTGQITTKSGESYDFESKKTYSLTVQAEDGNGGKASIAVTVNLTDVGTPVTACFTDLGTLTAAVEYAGAWDDAECKAHHFDTLARYLQFTVSEQKSVTFSLSSAGILYVSKGTPQNGWGTEPPDSNYRHRRNVRLENGKLLHNGGNTKTLTLSAGETYTVEAAYRRSSSEKTFTVNIMPQ